MNFTSSLQLITSKQTDQKFNIPDWKNTIDWRTFFALVLKISVTKKKHSSALALIVTPHELIVIPGFTLTYVHFIGFIPK